MKRVMLVLLLLGQGACVRHVYPYTQKVRAYENAEYAAADEARTKGSLWSEASPGLFEDTRARRVGDILTIRVDERSDATRDAATQLSTNSQTSLGLSSMFGAMQRLAAANPGLDPAALVGASASNEFDGFGNTTRSGNLQATLPVRIKRVLPNGDFYVEGHKVVLLNDEESFLYISGVARPIDIRPDNSIASWALADVELEYTGRGVISEQQEQGWLARLLNYIWPF